MKEENVPMEIIYLRVIFVQEHNIGKISIWEILYAFCFLMHLGDKYRKPTCDVEACNKSKIGDTTQLWSMSY